MPDNTRRRWPLEPDPDRDLTLDAKSLRAVAHPVRLRILGMLRTEGPATATGLAAKLGLNTGATSYHLRQLAAGGVIVEDTDRGTGRDRWWRAPHRSNFLNNELTQQNSETGAAYLRAIALVNAENMQRAVDEHPTLPREWQDAVTFSDFLFTLTPNEATQLLHELREVLARYRTLHEHAEVAPPGAQPFHLQLQGFLSPGLTFFDQQRDDD